MCTVVNQIGGYHLFGRTLDLSYTYGEEVVYAPKGITLPSPTLASITTTHAVMGVAHVAQDFPLYYDAVSEAGLCMAALNFPSYAMYHPPMDGKHNIASFELIPWLLGQCSTLSQAYQLLHEINITPHAFSPDLPPTPLHWMLSDATSSVVIESTKAGLEIHPNPVHVMTNAPDFPQQMTRLADYRHLSPTISPNTLCPTDDLPIYSQGLGSVGLPGGMTSTDRFVRGVYANTHTIHENTPEEEVNRFFHVMETVSQPKGCAITPTGEPIYTVYTSCGDPAAMIYYLTTYGCRCIQKFQCPPTLNTAEKLVRFPLQNA